MNRRVDLVTVRCPDCGPGYVPLNEIILRVNVETNIADLAFSCPVCAIRASIRISPESVATLAEVGVVADRWRLPTELLERSTEALLPSYTRSVRRLASELEEDIERLLRIPNSFDGGKT